MREESNGGRKADFTRIYDRPDPRAYFGTLTALEYQVPQEARPVVEAVLAASARGGRPRTVLDVCCSYGINAALLRCAVDLDELGARYTDPGLAALAPGEVTASDAAFFAQRLRWPGLTVLGLDASAPAIDHAVGAGLLADGWAENLETADPSPALVAGLHDVGLVVCTGGVGYIGYRTFERLLRAVGDPHDLWLVVFVLRVFGYDEIAATLGRHGLVTERVPGRTFRQRRFADAAEREAAMHDVVRRGVDPAGKEADGWYHADCYITRPTAAAAALPLTELLASV